MIARSTARGCKKERGRVDWREKEGVRTSHAQMPGNNITMECLSARTCEGVVTVTLPFSSCMLIRINKCYFGFWLDIKIENSRFPLRVMFGVVALLKLQMRWGAHSFYRLHCGAADGRKEAAFVIIFCVIYYLMRREMEETGAKRMRTSAFRSRK